MWWKLLWIFFMVDLILPCAQAEGNISIEDVGTEYAELIEGMRVPLFTALSNRGDTPVEIDLEFRLDSRNVSRKEGIALEPGTLEENILSDDVISFSPGNATIEVIAYIEDKEVARKSTQIAVQERQDVIAEKENNLIFWILAVAFVMLFSSISILLLLNRKKITQTGRVDEKGSAKINSSRHVKQHTVTDVRSLEIADMLSGEIRSFLREVEKQGEETREKEEFKLISSYLANVALVLENIGNDNSMSAEIGYENIKKDRENIISHIKNAQKSAASPAQNALVAELQMLRGETNRRKQFVDTSIPDLLLQMAEKKLYSGDIQGAEGIIFSTETLLKTEEVMQRLRKLREIGF